ncbi:6,7-dimethyl-8-ribityllumazine synthase [Fluviibacterium sp. DFM31]|uniref:6,7-dimethyl-8-ribityllumazine synthase n=1 Tax=Meridianimarinicoccus marinus TaxID=3231483 RepID=A0ABV3L775_9RHOB
MAGQAHESLPTPRFEGDAPRLLIVVAPYYRDIADQMVAGAHAEIEAAGATHQTIEVPGALEVPTAIRIAFNADKFDGFVALGCVIRGETTHYDTVCNDSSRAITLLGLQGACIGNGILTVENMDQAQARAEVAGQNKGGGAAAAALHLIALTRAFGSSSKKVGFRPE